MIIIQLKNRKWRRKTAGWDVGWASCLIPANKDLYLLTVRQQLAELGKLLSSVVVSRTLLDVFNYLFSRPAHRQVLVEHGLAMSGWGFAPTKKKKANSQAQLCSRLSSSYHHNMSNKELSGSLALALKVIKLQTSFEAIWRTLFGSHKKLSRLAF